MNQTWYQKVMKAVGVYSLEENWQEETCVIVGAMEQDNLERICSLFEGTMVIAADGGYRYLPKKANYVVGDFDSLGFVPKEEEIIQHPVRKDDTDMMLAVKIALEKGKKRLVLLGGIGGRLDHTIANINTLAYIKNCGCHAILIGERESIFLLTDEICSFDACGEGTISVFSYGQIAKGVSIKGLSYETKQVEFTNTFPLGVSNEFVNQPASIEVKDGSLLVILQNP